jgi:cytochrome b561
LQEEDAMSRLGEYGAVAKSFHWVTAALLVAQFTIGFIMPGLHGVTQPPDLVSLHFSLGTVILAIMAVRLLWRLARGVPAPLADHIPYWQQRAAEILHGVLYLLLFAVIFSGWAYASSHNLSVTFFGLTTLPALFAGGAAIGRTIGELHVPLAWTLLGAIGLHIAAAFAHSLIWRDGVMSRMLPRLN